MSEEAVSAPEQVEEQGIGEIQEESQAEGIQSEEVQEPIQEGGVEEVQAESESELKEEIADAIEDGASEKEVAAMVKQYTLKVKGREFTKEVDLSDDDAVTRILQREAAGQLAQQEAAELKKAYEQELVRIKQNPWEVLKELGLDERSLVEDKIQELIKQDQKSPEEVEREQIQLELKAARAKSDKLEKQMQEREAQALYEQESVKLKQEIRTELDAHTTLHASPKITRMVAENMEFAINELGMDDVGVKDVLPAVEAQLMREMNDIFSEIDEDALERYVGKANLDKIRQKRVAEVKKTTSIADIKQESAKPALKSDKKAEKVRLDDFMRRR